MKRLLCRSTFWLFLVGLLSLAVSCIAEEGDVPGYRLRPSKEEPDKARQFVSSEKAQEMEAHEEYLLDKQARAEYMRNKGSSLYIGKKPWMRKKREKEASQAEEMEVYLEDQLKHQEAVRAGLSPGETAVEEAFREKYRSLEFPEQVKSYTNELLSSLESLEESEQFEKSFTMNMPPATAPEEKHIELRKLLNPRKETLEGFGPEWRDSPAVGEILRKRRSLLQQREAEFFRYEDYVIDPMLILLRDGTLYQYLRDIRGTED